jgi:O-antigen/teichoic acid export membrane protein
MTTPPPELRRLARGGIGGLAGAMVSAVSGFAFVAIVARGFAPAEVGLFFALNSLFLLASAVVELGGDVGLVRFLAMYLAGAEHRKVASVIVAVLAPTFALAVVVALVTAAVATGLVSLVGGSSVPSAETMVVLLAAFLPIATMSDLLLATTRGLGTVKPTIVSDGIVRQGLQPILALVAVTVVPHHVTALVIAWAGPYVVSFLMGLRAVTRLLHGHGVRLHHFRNQRAVFAETAKGVWRFNSARSVAQVAQMTIRRMDIPLVSAFAGPSAAAVYTAASRFVALGQLGIKGVQQMVGPQVARLLGEGRLADAGIVLRTATTWSVVLAWPVYLICAVLPDLFLAVFGPHYSSGIPAVVILSLAMLVGTAAGPVDIALLMSGRSVQSLVNNLSALITNLALNLLLIPRIGLVGAAIAWAVAIIISNALPTFQIEKAVGFRANDRRTAQAAVLAVTCVGLLPFLAWLVGMPPVWRVAAAAVGLVAYLLGLLHYREDLHLNELAASVARR